MHLAYSTMFANWNLQPSLMCFKKLIFISLLSLLSFNVLSQSSGARLTPEEYIKKYKDLAIREMIENSIPASITLAQGILETDCASSPLALNANNHFGIKCHLDWTGSTYIHDDERKNECFRKYESAEASYIDHSQFLKSRNWYKPLFELQITDYKGWAKGLKKAGYATDREYAQKIIKIIEENNLNELDKVNQYAVKTLLVEKSITPKKTISPISVVNSSEYELQINNERKFIIAKQGDDISKLAKHFEMKEWQFYTYNDLQKGAKLKAGDIVYLQPKRNRTHQEYHIVKNGEDMHTISQIYCIKLKKLYENNLMTYGSQPKEGEKLYLRRKKA